MTKQNQNKKRIKQYVDQNPVEAFRDIGTGVVHSIKSDVVSGSIDTFWRQFLGGEKSQTGGQVSGDLAPGIELDLRETQRTEEIVAPGLDYHREVRTAEVRVAKENEVELQKRIAQIQFELKNLAKSSRELQTIFKEVTVETVPQKPGKYHLNFFEWLLNIVQQARLKIEESKSWLAIFYQRQAKKHYWAMFKKHGTTFGLSHERVVATQTG